MPAGPRRDLAASPRANWRCCACWPPGSATPNSPALFQLSEATVKTHVARILAKLNLRDRAQAVVLAYETGLVSPRER